MRKPLGVGVTLIAAALTLTACGNGGTTTADPTTSTSASVPPAASSAPADAGSITIWVDSNREPVLKPIAEQFKADTGVTVNLTVKDNSKIVDDFITQAPTGTGPDAIAVAHDNIGKLVQNGVIAPIELGSKAGDFEDVAVKGFTLDGKVYGVPYSTESLGLIRNKAMAATAPTTWDELIAASTAANAEQAVLIGMDSVASASPYNLYPFQTSFGAPVFEQAADGSYDSSKLAMGGEAGAAFATWLKTQSDAGHININISNDIAKEQFTTGKSPFFVTGPWNIADIKAAGIDYAIDPLPSAGGQTAAQFVGVQGFAMSAKAANTVATQKFLVEYLGGEEAQTALYKLGNRPPANSAALEAAKADADTAQWGIVSANGVPMPNVPAMGSVWEDWGATEAAIISGKSTDPAADWEAMVTAIAGKI